MTSDQLGFNIHSFSLPNSFGNEIRFEEPRDIAEIALAFRGAVPRKIEVEYLQRSWPKVRWENRRDMEQPFFFGWSGMDDQFNVKWRKAAVKVKAAGNKAYISFEPLGREFPETKKDYDVRFRRTLGIRVKALGKWNYEGIFTTTPVAETKLLVRGDKIRQIKKIEGYNARVISWDRSGPVHQVHLVHSNPSSRYSGDQPHVLFDLGHPSTRSARSGQAQPNAFTISLTDLRNQGPIWYEEEGIFITREGDSTSFEQYQKNRGQTVAERIKAMPEQSLAASMAGQPRPHPAATSLGWKHARQKFWLEPNGDLVLHKNNLDSVPGKDTVKFLNKGYGRFFFGLERWQTVARFADPAPALAYNIHARRDSLRLEQRTICIPANGLAEAEGAPDDSLAALMRFRIVNDGPELKEVRLPLKYSQNSDRSYNLLQNFSHWEPGDQDEFGVPRADLDKLEVQGKGIYSRFKGKPVLRALLEGEAVLQPQTEGLALVCELAPGESRDLVLKVPYVHLSPQEVDSLDTRDFVDCDKAAGAFWQKHSQQGAQLNVPMPELNTLHAAHLTEMAITDSAMPDEPWLVNTSVGTSTYGNYTNESCMIITELHQRGLFEEARRRLEVWVKYQGTAKQPGNFTDYRGMYFGAGGFERGAYNQHHGWALWCLAEHYFYTRDKAWLKKVAGSMIAGADWIFRQRKNTKKDLPRSRGWERGFLPAGSLEDVEDFHYWLSTNALTWRGANRAAEALEAIGHPQAKRVRREADGYGEDLRRGFETMCQHSPLVRLNDGRWVPHYPSRIYCRGRDFGWIREVLEGAVYLLISGLYAPDSKQAAWILDDFQDNLYPKAPFGYPMADPRQVYFRGGFSMQPNLLAGLMPHLERDEPEVYLWMFFNAFASCWREEIQTLIEHPSPELGYSNSAHFKTSDQANSVTWMRFMLVWARKDLLHLGRAVPKAWFKSSQPFSLEKAATVHGEVSVRYQGTTLQADLPKTALGVKVLARFRHPQGKRIRLAMVNGKKWLKFDEIKGDVDLSGMSGKVEVKVSYAS
jgi:hypothetical protein